MSSIAYKENSFIQLLIMLALTEFARGMFILSFLPGLPAISTQMTLTIASLAVTLHFVTDAASNIFIGGVMKRFGEKKVLLVSFMLGLIGFSLVTIQDNNILYIIAAIILGIAACPIWIITLASIREEVRGKQMGIVYFVWLSGLLSGMVVMNFLLTIEPRRFIVLFPLFFLVNLIVLIFTKVHVVNRKEIGVKEQLGNMLRVIKSHVPVMPGVLLQALAIGMLIPVLPSFIVREASLELNHYTIILGVAGAVCSIAIVSIGKILDTFQFFVTKLIIVIGFTIFGAAILSVVGAESFVVIMIIAISLGLVYGILLPSWNKFIASNIHPDLKGETWGFFNFAQGVGTMVGPLIGGLLVDLTGQISTTFYVAGAIFFSLACFYLIYFLMNRQKHIKKEAV